MSNLIFPVKNGYVTHGFDEDRNGKPHGGYDIGSKTQPAYIVACCDCKIYAAGWSDSDKTKSFGLRIWLEPLDKELKKKYPFIVYGHMEKINVLSGKIIKEGDIVGIMGNTGASKGVHLHAEARNLPSVKGKSIRILEFES